MIIKPILEQDEGLIIWSHRETCGIQHLRLPIWTARRLEFLAILILDWTVMIFWVQICFSACRKRNSLAIDGGTPHFHMYSHCTHHTARMHVYIGSSLSCVPKIGSSSTRHVSPCASQYIEHQHKFSLTYLSCVTVVLFSEPRPVVHASICPVWRSTVGWYFYGIPLLHRCWIHWFGWTNQWCDSRVAVHAAVTWCLFHDWNRSTGAGRSDAEGRRAFVSLMTSTGVLHGVPQICCDNKSANGLLHKVREPGGRRHWSQRCVRSGLISKQGTSQSPTSKPPRCWPTFWRNSCVRIPLVTRRGHWALYRFIKKTDPAFHEWSVLHGSGPIASLWWLITVILT